MFACKLASLLVFVFLAISVCSGKHTLHVDDVLSSATNTVVLREVDSDLFAVSNLDLNFINLNLQGDSNFIMDTEGPLSFDGSFIGFDSPKYVRITGENEAILDTTGSASLSGDSLEIDALRFILSSGGDLFMNTDSSIIGNAHRVGISSLTHAEIAVASGPLELLAGADLEMTGSHVELLGDDRISLYSMNSLTVDTQNDFQAYSAFIDFDSFGDIKLNSQTGNIHVDTIRNIIFEAEDIDFEAAVGIDFQSEHGEIYVDAADTFSGHSDDVIFVETSDEVRYIASNDFLLSSVDLSLSTSELVKFHSKTLEIVFSDAIFQSHTTEVTTGGDIDFLLNSSQFTSYSMGSTNGIIFESRNIDGESSSLLFETESSGDIEIYATSEFDSSFNFATGEYSVVSGGDSTVSAPVIRVDANRVDVTGLNIDIRSDSSIGDTFNAEADDDININASGSIKNSIAESGVWRATSDTLTFSSGKDLTIQSGELFDENLSLESNSLIELSSEQVVNIGADRTLSGFHSLVDITTLLPGNTFGMGAFNMVDITGTGDMRLSAGDQISWELDELSWESSDDFRISSDENTTFSSAEIDFWANGRGNFESITETINFSAAETLHFQAFTDLLIENFASIDAGLVYIEATESADVSVGVSQNYITEAILEFSASGLYGIDYQGNSVSATGSKEIYFEGGFINMIASENLIVSASVFNVHTLYEEDIRFFAIDTIDWSLQSGIGFVTSADDVILNSFENDIFLTSTDSNAIFNIDQGYENYIEDSFTIISGVDTTLNSINGNIDIDSASDIDFFAFSSSFDFTRSFIVDVEGDADTLFENDLTFTSTNSFNIIQSPGPSSIDDISFSGTDEKITLTGSFTQNGGSTTIDAGNLYSQSSTTSKILLDSSVSSYFDIFGTVSMNAQGEDGYIRLIASDFHGKSLNDISIQAGEEMHISSSWSDKISSTSVNGNIDVTSGSSSPITWNSVETFNVTALNTFRATSSDMIDGVGIWLAVKDDVMSEMNIFTREDTISIISLDSQTFSADVVSFTAGQDITFTNFFPPLEVGGVKFITSGSSHDGTYEDETGISIRTHSELSEIYFNILQGSSSISSSNEDIKNIISDARGFWNAKEDITFFAESGDIEIYSEQGTVILQSNLSSVTFVTTDASTELQAYDSINTLAGKAISLVSTDPITNNDDNNVISFDFSALDGNIITKAVVSQPLFFEGSEFDINSNEETYLLAADDLPFLTINNGINVNGNTGIYLKVDGGDLDITASDEIFLSSAENFDTRIESGNDMNYIAIASTIELYSTINNVIRTKTGNVLFQTQDSTGDIIINSESEIRFQADGTDDNIGASQVDGIFVDAPQIQAFARDDITFDAGEFFTVGPNTRPIISFEAGGSSTSHGVSFTAEGNINQVIGANFLISSNGAMLWESNDLSVTSSGAIDIASKGSLLEGKDVLFQSDQKTSISADNIDIHGVSQIALYSENILFIESDLLIDLDIAGILSTSVRNIYDINAADWTWTASDSFTLDTRGDVVISNGNIGSTNIYGDISLSFNSDIANEFFTFGENSPITISTLGSTSPISIISSFSSSDILFETSGIYTASSISDSTFKTLGEIQITSPLDSLYSNIDSTIDIISAGDLFFEADVDSLFSAVNGFNITAVSDMDLSVIGYMNIQSWGDGYFASTGESLSFSAPFNITFISELNQNGDIILSSTRDIEQTVIDNALNIYDGDYSVTAQGTFELFMDNINLKTIGENSDISFISVGPTELDITDNSKFAGGDIYITATTGAATINAVDSIELTTNGYHNNIDISSNFGVLSFEANDNSNTDLFSFNSPLNSNTKTPSQRNGNGFLDFYASGIHPTDGYSIKLDTLNNINVDTEFGKLNLYSQEELTFEIGSDINIFGETIEEIGFTISALTPGGSAYFDVEIGTFELDVSQNLDIFADDTIFILPFDNLFFSAAQGSASTLHSDILIQATHPSGDIDIFTTDFLTADIIFSFTGDVEVYSEQDTTYLLLDDDDAAVVGTFLVTVGGSINVGAENDLTIAEIGPGDIQINDQNGQFFFTAGNDIIVTARQILELNLNILDVTSGRDFTMSSSDTIDFTVSSFGFTAEDRLTITGDDHSFFGGTSVTISTSDGDIDLSGSDINQEVYINTLIDMEFVADTINIEVPPHRVIDFRDGLIIPVESDGDVTTDPCNSDRSFYFDNVSNNICYCHGSTVQCLSTFVITTIF